MLRRSNWITSETSYNQVQDGSLSVNIDQG